MNPKDSKNRLLEANKILTQSTTSAEKLESLSIILKGISPKLDKALEICTQNFSRLENLQKGDVISLSAQSLPENSEDEKKRKKAILAFIRVWKDLQQEVERVKAEIDTSQSVNQQAQGAGRIIAFAKGPFGLITIAAVLVTGLVISTNLNNPPQDLQSQSSVKPSTAPERKIKVIIVDGKKIPLSEVKEVTGPECDQDSHYHAQNSATAKALDGTIIPDPGGCGYGKTTEVAVVEE